MGVSGQVSGGSYSSLHCYQGVGSQLEGRFPTYKLGLPTLSGDNRASGESHSLLYPSLARAEICPGIAQSSSLSVPFLSNVLGAKGFQLSKTNNGSLSSQSFALQKALQDGRPEEDQQVHPSGHVGSETRLEGCLLAPSSSRRDPALLRLRPGGSAFPLPKASIRSVHGSVGLHAGPRTRQEGIKIGGSESHLFPGRLLDPGSLLRGGSGPYGKGDPASSEAGFSHQLGEILSSSIEEIGVPGGDNRPSRDVLFTPTGEGSRNSQIWQSSSGSNSVKKGPRITSRLPKFCGGLSSTRKTVAKASPKMGEFPLFPSQKRGGNFPGRGSEGGSLPLDGPRVPGVLSSNSATLSAAPLNDGRFRRRVGRSPAIAQRGLLGREWSVARRAAGSLNELVRAEGYPLLYPSLPSTSAGQVYWSPVRQQDSVVMPEKTGFSGLSFPLVPLQGYFPPLQESENLPFSFSFERSLKCPGRQSLEEDSYSYGMVSGRPVIPSSMPRMGVSRSRYHGHLGKQETLLLRLPLPGLSGFGMGYFLLRRLEQLGFNLRFSPVDRGSSGESNTEITLIPGEGFPDSSPVALQGLVPFPSREVSCQAPPPGGFFSDPTSFGGRGHLPRGFRLKPLRLEVMREALLQEGFSHRAIEVILGCHKISTIKQYQSAWSRFLNFLEKEKIRHDRIRLCHVLNFLSFEQEVNERAYSTIAAYKCALFLPLKIALNLDLAGERVEKMMNGFYNLAPPEKRPMPSWDLSAFLFYLQSDRFEPIESIPFQDLALKLLALLALGTGRRIGELAELSRSTYEKSGRVFIKWLPGYRAKWDSAHSRFIPHHPSIQAMKSRSALSLRLCPLRVLSCYLERRKDVVRQDKDDCLWLRKIDGLSRDLRGLIKASRRWSNEPAEVICFPHQLKKLAVSYSFKYFSKAEMSLPGIVGNSSWKTLKDNYLGDVPPLRCTCVLPLGTVDPAKLRGRRRQ